MFWYLLFAHFVADYPLQTDWIAKNKARLDVLLLHVLTHLATSLVLIWPSLDDLWPYLIVLAAIHFVIDFSKNWLRRTHSGWITWPYLFDQVLHGLTIWLVVAWAQSNQAVMILPLDPRVFVIASAYLVITQVWFISERIIAIPQPEYQQQVIAQATPRMVVRSALLTFWLVGASLALPAAHIVPGLSAGLVLAGIAALAAGLTLALRKPYAIFRRRALFSDMSASLALSLAIILYSLF